MDYSKGEVLISIRNVSLKFGEKLILRDVNADIHNICRPDSVQGQVVCFLGPSGIGKTQLSRIVAGLQVPTTGSVILEDGDLTSAGKVGMVPQNYLVFDFLTVNENFKVATRQGHPSPHAMDWDRGEELVTYFGLKDHLDKYPSQLSGGQRQRVAICRQLLCDHRTIVMDEPFSGLDPLMKQKACRVITQAANLHEKNTIIVVTHDIIEGMSIADTVWLMGREKDQDGAKIVETYDLAKEGLCWREDIIHEKSFLENVAEVKDRFLEIASN